ncbi:MULTISPECIES: NUDIX hydrolase [Acinetobacter]|uniref:NUDIX domain-containing protein n=1 Tax=Acinetobacter genomosp. 15BJ TaxID=106651 RepID=A0ABT8UZK4_9GAMM|nr:MULTISPECIES: NUDIX domain-containing protein [Acinetobacter]MCI3879185.1 NUDIX domain-containing protein [Acinetobacter higginsii]MDO3657516.1 NUDIX domain-containing protein [Acinetobacter genomosp. 15BJ]
MTLIRAKALCLFRHHEKVLLAKAYDRSKDEYFFRPIGGGIEFGETSVQAIEREVEEEIQQQLTQPKLICVLENLFRFDGQQGHEIVFVYDAKLVDSDLYNQQEIQGNETNGYRYIAQWLSREQIELTQSPVYPKGIEQWLFND